MSMTASQITSLTIIYSTVYSGADQRKHQSYVSLALLAFVRGIRRWTVNSLPKGPETLKMFPFDDVITNCMYLQEAQAPVKLKVSIQMSVTWHSIALLVKHMW